MRIIFISLNSSNQTTRII